MKKIIIAAVILIAVGTGLFFVFRSDKNVPKYVTEKITRGDIKATVLATGTVNAVTTVQVGTQVSGTIKQLFADYNSPVRKGQLLAQIDPAIFEAQVGQAQANLMSAKAGLEKTQVALRDAKTTYERSKTLFAKNFIARSDLDTAETNYLSALSQIKVAEAQIQQTKAALDSASINLKYSRIVSPVDGTVISRNVDIGQTVAASFQTPTLFTIAQDLTKMQINTSIDEADIGKIKVGQHATFTVDAYPELTFQGKVSVVRNAPITLSNVVTYDAVITVDNTDMKLKPGMTANVSTETAMVHGSLRVPNAALRFKPSATGKASVNNNEQKGEKAAKGPGVWILENKKPAYVKITTGISDGSYTEVTSGNLNEGQQIILEDASGGKKKTNPAAGAPRFMR
ncbi:MAG: efflux RND transporter periplasmic adaptor subunit [Deltaproteobacteria bacterium HGW-Deltaproteobacteria-12]|jgi:HlyD family secretion protein|nr:MAG: efflux RND transporter periplasmic adaptor subunit [Deltaproteobacteria bacterium HGW-Deltaproteobacteria-12]